MTTTEKITEIIQWFEILPTDYNNLNDLSQKMSQLATQSFYLGKAVGDFRKEYRKAYFKRKIKRASTFIKHKTDKTAAESDHQSRLDCKEEYLIEMEAEGNKEKGGIIIHQVNRVLDAMNQRLSVMKIEYKETQNQ